MGGGGLSAVKKTERIKGYIEKEENANLVEKSVKKS